MGRGRERLLAYAAARIDCFRRDLVGGLDVTTGTHGPDVQLPRMRRCLLDEMSVVMVGVQSPSSLFSSVQ